MSEAKSSLFVELYQGRSWRSFERHFLVIVTQRIDDIWHLKETRSGENKMFNHLIRYYDVGSAA